MNAIAGPFGRVVVPFDAPELYARPDFGCPVVRGDRFAVLLCTGEWLTP